MRITGRMIDRKKENINNIRFQYVWSMNHLIKGSVIKHQSILNRKKGKSPELIETEYIDSGTNLIGSSTAKSRPNH
jgi:hypothetical protein